MTAKDLSKTGLGIPSLGILCAILMAVIFTVDLAIPLGVAMGVPYVAVVLISLWLPRRATILVAIACSLLTFGAYFYKPAVPEMWKALCNRSLAVFAICVSAGLGLQRKKAEEQREEAFREKEKAMGELRILRGLLPICASCKKIKTDQGDWRQMEVYIRDHSEAEFSHGICPECMKTLYPEFCKPTSAGDVANRDAPEK
ncbi:MAG: hypothetical protein FJ109_12000 [Deltaproteobacteria bacterium]|nr:hypothetical protein [Deltaproteobacteria bacterium]